MSTLSCLFGTMARLFSPLPSTLNKSFRMSSTKQVKGPSWITPAFIEEALHYYGFTEEKVLDLDFEDPTGSGDHYSCSVLRVTAILKGFYGETARFPVIVKSAPVGDTVVESVNASLATESRMLSELLPEMHDMIQAKAPGYCSRFGPICFHYGTHPVPFIVMEDLTFSGFRLADRIDGLDLAQSITAAKALGHYHAASFALLKQNPELADVLVSGFLRPREEVKAFVRTSFQSVATACRSWKNFPEEFKKILDDLTDTAIDRFSELATPSPSTLNVILHSDFWTNNIMLRPHGQLPYDVRFVDFQTSCAGPAVLDYLHFLNTSLEESVSRIYTELLTEEYYGTLSRTMNILELEPPSYLNFTRQINSHAFYGLFGAICVVPLVRARRDAKVDIASLLQGDADKNVNVYSSPVVENFLKRILPVYKQKGWLSNKTYDGVSPTKNSKL